MILNKTIAVIVAVFVVAGAVFGFGVYKLRFAINDTPIVNIGATGPKDATYKINGVSVTLKSGVSEISAAPGSASKIITRYFGNEVTHDFNGDGRPDTAFILTQDMGGSGTFYYAVASLNTENGYVGSDAVLLGDRIAPQTTEMGKGNVFIVNYADRIPGEPFSVKPSQGKSIWLLLDPKTMQLGEVLQNFEGEANPSMMTLGMKEWGWVNTTYSDGVVVTPREPSRFSLAFAKESFTAYTDCNSAGGQYSATGDKIIFSKIISTMMACQNSQEGDFVGALQNVTNYHFTSKGELVFDLDFARRGTNIQGKMTLR